MTIHQINDTTPSCIVLATSHQLPAHLQQEDDSNNNSTAPSLAFALKPACRRHRQFLPEHDECTHEPLKGYDHTVMDTSCGSSNDNDSYSSPEKVSAVKQRGGGSWLLGFARLHHHSSHHSSEVEAEVTSTVPGLVRSTSSSSLESSSSDDCASTTSSSSSSSIKKKGVSFNESVTSHHIPHSSTYTPAQRRRMYSSSLDVRQNKIRNKKEYRYDGYDWRNCTEEWEMSVCMVTGELVHPVHSF
jgi:hypothetical protein